MDDIIRNTAKDIVDKLAPVEDDDNDAELDAENEDFFSKAIPLMKKALKEWKEEHGPDEHCDIRIVKGDDGSMAAVVTPIKS